MAMKTIVVAMAMEIAMEIVRVSEELRQVGWLRHHQHQLHSFHPLRAFYWQEYLAESTTSSVVRLSQAQLSHAQLPHAQLPQAQPSQAQLSQAQLSLVQLSQVQLSKAWLTEALLFQVLLSQALLSHVQLSSRLWRRLSCCL